MKRWKFLLLLGGLVTGLLALIWLLTLISWYLAVAVTLSVPLYEEIFFFNFSRLRSYFSRLRSWLKEDIKP